MKIKHSIKYSMFFICALSIGSSHALEEKSLFLSSKSQSELREKEILAKQANKKLAEEVKDQFVNEKLFGKDKFSDMGLRVTARKGVVTISGRVESDEDINQAVSLAKSVEGVKSVYSKMVVKLIKQPPLTDEKLVENVREKFVREKLFGKNKFEDMGIQVLARDGVVTLSGSVGSDADAQKIIRLTKAIHGVKNVESKMVIH